MAEPNVEVIAPTTPTIEAPAAIATPNRPTSAADRRASAMEVAITDVPDGSLAESLEAAGEPPVVEAPKVEPKPAEQPDPLAARAAADRFLMRERETLKAEREAIAKERADWESSKQAGPDVGAELAKFHRTLAADPVAYADAQKWTPEQRYEMAKQLAWSAQPEDKRPAGWRGGGQGHVLSEVEQLRQENLKLAEKMTSWEKSQAEQQQKAQAEQRTAALGAEILKGLPAEGLDHARAFAGHAPEAARRDLAMLADEMVTAEREAAARDYREPKRLAAADVLQEYDRRWKAQLDQQYGWAAKLRAGAPPAPAPSSAPRVPPASSTASPSSPRNGKTTREERLRAAKEALPDKLD